MENDGRLGINFNQFRLLVKRKGLTYEDLAKGAGISRATIYHLLDSDNPPASTVNRIAKFLGVHYADLLTENQKLWRRSM